MTLDEALGKIKVEENKKSQKETPSQDFTPTNMEEDARKVINPFLIKFFSGQVEGQKTMQNLSTISADIINKYGMDLFNILPGGGGGGSTYFPAIPSQQFMRLLSTEFNSNKFTDKLVQEILVSICGEYSLETDLASLATKQNFEVLKETVPEIKKVEEELIGEYNTAVQKDRAILHPLVVVMSLDLKYRPLAILAVKKGIEKKRVAGVKTLPDQNYRQWYAKVKPFITPNAQDYVEVAKQYDIKEVIPTIQAVEQVLSDYENVWFP